MGRKIKRREVPNVASMVVLAVVTPLLAKNELVNINTDKEKTQTLGKVGRIDAKFDIR